MSELLNTRIRSASKGTQHLQNINSKTTSFFQFLEIISAHTGIPPEQQRLLYGYPPRLWSGTKDALLNDLTKQGSISNGELITVEQCSDSQNMQRSLLPSSTSSTTALVPPITKTNENSQKIASSISTSMTTSASPNSTATAAVVTPSSRTATPSSVNAKDSAVAVSDTSGVSGEGTFVRRVMDADNSCLFNSIGYVLEGHSRNKWQQLRQLIANHILNDTENFNDVILGGKSNEQYSKWISNKDSWGGAIELSIFSRLYNTEIAAIDIQNLRVDIYGEGSNYKQRVYLIYDGIHYDALALTFAEDLPEDMDVTVFSTNDLVAFSKARNVAEEAKKKKEYTDVAKFDLRCLVCQKGLVGQKEAVEHAKSTGHQNFAEYK